MSDKPTDKPTNKPTIWRRYLARARRIHPAYRWCAPASILALVLGYTGQAEYTANWYAIADKYDTTPEVVIATDLQAPLVEFTRTDTYTVKGVRFGGHLHSYWTTAQSNDWYFLHNELGLLCEDVLGDYRAAVRARYGSALLDSLMQTATAFKGKPVALLVSVPRFKEKPEIPSWCAGLTYDAQTGELRFKHKRVAYLLSGRPQQRQEKP